MKIKNFDVNKKVLVIAEIGNNHEGNFEVAKEMVRQAAQSGADAVKFQTFKTEFFINEADAARFARLKSFELTPQQFRELSDLARKLGVMFFSTPFDLESIEVLDPIVDAFKIASGDLPFFLLIAAVLKKNKPTILATGASDMAMVERTFKFIQSELKTENLSDRLSLLHCVSSYPAPVDQVGLRAIVAMSHRFRVPIGFSDHVLGIDAAVAAVALGARVIEKHFTLDKNYSEFRDHQLSADPHDLAEMVKRIRAVESYLGNEEKIIQPCEKEGVIAFRRSIVSARELKVGTVVSFSDLMWTRPAGGMAPGEENLLIGKKTKKDLPKGHRFSSGDVV